MSELEGIKDFIEANKSSLENMNQEMIASRGRVPLVWLTIEEAKILLECACCVDAYTFAKCKKLFNCLERRIEQAKTGNE